MLDNEEDFIDYIKEQKYLVIFPDESCKMYSTLRDIEKDISIDFTTIHKKLKNKVHTFIFAKGTNYLFYIRRIQKLS
jgi:hypothetical protein